MASSAFMAMLVDLARVVLVLSYLHDAERRVADHNVDFAPRPPLGPRRWSCP